MNCESKIFVVSKMTLKWILQKIKKEIITSLDLTINFEFISNQFIIFKRNIEDYFDYLIFILGFIYIQIYLPDLFPNITRFKEHSSN